LGTFVVGPRQVIESGLEVLESLETQAEKIGLDLCMGDYEVKPLKANERLAKKLNVQPGDPLVDIRRVILTEGAPVAYLVDILPEGIISPEALEKQFTGSVLDLLIHLGEPPLSISKTEISAINAPGDVSKALGIQRGDTLLLLNGLLFNADGDPIDVSHSYFLPGYFRLHIIRKIGGVSS
jgi:GntR family transcriptional regulator